MVARDPSHDDRREAWLTGPERLLNDIIRMDSLALIADLPTAPHWWWRGEILAARWRD